MDAGAHMWAASADTLKSRAALRLRAMPPTGRSKKWARVSPLADDNPRACCALDATDAAHHPVWATTCLEHIFSYCASPRDIGAMLCCGRRFFSICKRFARVAMTDMAQRRWPELALVLHGGRAFGASAYASKLAGELGYHGDFGGLRPLEQYCFTLEVLLRDRHSEWSVAYACRGGITPDSYVFFCGVPKEVGRRMARAWIAIGADNDVRVKVHATQLFGQWRRALLFDGHAHGFEDGAQWCDGDVPLHNSPPFLDNESQASYQRCVSDLSLSDDASHSTESLTRRRQRNLPAFHLRGILGLAHAVLPDIDIYDLISRRVQLRLEWRLGYYANCYDYDVPPHDDLPTGQTAIYAHFAVPDPNHWQRQKDASPNVIAEYLHAVDFS